VAAGFFAPVVLLTVAVVFIGLALDFFLGDRPS